MRFLVTFEKIDSALFARAADALWVEGFDVGRVQAREDSPVWIGSGDVGAMVHVPANVPAPELVAGRIARTVAHYVPGAKLARVL